MQTWSTSSPTTTSAVNENRRPPFTTLATRLIFTTRSCRSRPATSDPRAAGLRDPGLGATANLELQSVLAGSVGERLDPPVVKGAAAVEHDCGDARILGPLGDELADGRGGLDPLRLRERLVLAPSRRRPWARRLRGLPRGECAVARV